MKKRKEKKILSLYCSLNEFMLFFYLYFQYSKDRYLEKEYEGLVMESGFYISLMLEKTMFVIIQKEEDVFSYVTMFRILWIEYLN